MFTALKEQISKIKLESSWYQDNANKKTIAMLMLIAFIFSISCRLFLVYNEWGNQQFMFDGAPIIKSPDGFYFAQGAKNIIDSVLAFPNEKFISQITAIFYFITPGVSFGWLVYFLPIVLSSIIVAPIILIGRELGSTTIGFFAALISSVSIGFYYRSFAGYYDDDFIAFVLPFFFIHAVMLFVRKNDFRAIIYVAFMTLIYSYAYGNANTVIAVTIGLYSLSTFRKNISNSAMYLMIGIVLLMASNMTFLQKLVVGIFAILFAKDSLANRKLSSSIFFAIIGFVAFAYFGGFDSLFSRFNYYIFKPIYSADGSSLHFFSTLKTVAESQYSDFNSLYRNMAGNIYLFYIGLLGYATLVYRDRRFLLLLVMLAIGLMAIDGGMRFTPYGSPVLALGIVYIIASSVSILRVGIARLVLLSALSVYAMYPGFMAIKAFSAPPVLIAPEVNSLKDLSAQVKPNDYIVSWWDYGYQNRYYTGAKTLSDGGAQEGARAYQEAMALVMPGQSFAANWLRESVEANEKAIKGDINTSGSMLSDIMKYGSYRTDNPWKLVEKMSAPDFNTTKKSGDIYWLMPFRMLQIFSTIIQFADTDPVTGNMNKKRIFMYSQDFKEDNSSITFANGVKVLKNEGIVVSGSEKVPVGKFYKVFKPDVNITAADVTEFYKNSPYSLVYIVPLRAFIFADELTLQSNFIQMYIFGNYDNRLFELTQDYMFGKIYKLKK